MYLLAGGNGDTREADITKDLTFSLSFPTAADCQRMVSFFAMHCVALWEELELWEKSGLWEELGLWEEPELWGEPEGSLHNITVGFCKVSRGSV